MWPCVQLDSRRLGQLYRMQGDDEMERNARIGSASQRVLSSSFSSASPLSVADREVILLSRSFALDLENPSGLHQHFLMPNEFNPRAVIPHFKQQEGGWHLCAGTERLFSNAALCPYPREGFIGIDIDSHVKAYNDFNIFLLTVSQDQQQYSQLAEQPASDQWQERVSQLHQLLDASSLSSERKQYYAHYLESFAAIFYPAKAVFMNSVKSSLGKELIDYHHRDKQAFKTLQTLSRDGKLGSLCADINTIEGFAPEKIAEIDISNIYDYTWLDLQWAQPSSAVHVIWTRGVGHGSGGIPATKFFSFDYTALDRAGREKMEWLKRAMKQMGVEGIRGQTACAMLAFEAREAQQRLSSPHQAVIDSYSQESWQWFQEYAENHLFGNETIGFFDTYHWKWSETIARLNAAPFDQLKAAVEARKMPQAFVKKLCATHASAPCLTPSVYQLFLTA